MPSLQSMACSTVLGRMIVSPANQNKPKQCGLHARTKSYIEFAGTLYCYGYSLKFRCHYVVVVYWADREQLRRLRSRLYPAGLGWLATIQTLLDQDETHGNRIMTLRNTLPWATPRTSKLFFHYLTYWINQCSYYDLPLFTMSRLEMELTSPR